MAKRHKDAIAIQMGACNPSGIAHSIISACQEMRADPAHSGTAEICADPAIRLMVHQLAFLTGVFAVESDLWLYGKLTSDCETAIRHDDIRDKLKAQGETLNRLGLLGDD